MRMSVYSRVYYSYWARKRKRVAIFLKFGNSVGFSLVSILHWRVIRCRKCFCWYLPTLCTSDLKCLKSVTFPKVLLNRRMLARPLLFNTARTSFFLYPWYIRLRGRRCRANRLPSAIWRLNPFSSAVHVSIDVSLSVDIYIVACWYMNNHSTHIRYIPVLTFIFVPGARSCYPLSRMTRFVCTRKRNTRQRVPLIRLCHRRLQPANKYCCKIDFLRVLKKYFCLKVLSKTDEHKIIHANNIVMQFDRLI